MYKLITHVTDKAVVCTNWSHMVGYMAMLYVQIDHMVGNKVVLCTNWSHGRVYGYVVCTNWSHGRVYGYVECTNWSYSRDKAMLYVQIDHIW